MPPLGSRNWFVAIGADLNRHRFIATFDWSTVLATLTPAPDLDILYAPAVFN